MIIIDPCVGKNLEASLLRKTVNKTTYAVGHLNQHTYLLLCPSDCMSQLDMPHNNSKNCNNGKLKLYAKSGKLENIKINNNDTKINGTLTITDITEKIVSGAVVVIGTLKKGPIPVALSLK